MSTSPSDRAVLESFCAEFELLWTEPERKAVGVLEYGKPTKYIYTKKHGPSALDTRHPFYAALNRQADRAADVVKEVERFLNQPQRFVLPARIQCGEIHASERSLAVARVNDKWRLVVHSWSWFPGAPRFQRSPLLFARQRPRPWLECGLLDKVWTIKFIPLLLDDMLMQFALLAKRATENEGALARVVNAMKTTPAQ